ncbi:MAG: hypothetical protein WC796_05245 [Candidatus Pacearchaeota archaeon]|jgi:hypothetical protein
MTQNETLEVETRQELERLNIGQQVRVFGRDGVYAGLEWVQTCSCPCENTFQFPIIIHLSEDGRINREVVYSLEKPLPKRVTSVSITQSVKESDKRYAFYMRLLEQSQNNPAGNSN